ncbi:MAG: GGDEF domain-containing protein [Polyangiaceae bacterium]
MPIHKDDDEEEENTARHEREFPRPPKSVKPGEACLIMIYGPELGRRDELGRAPFEIGRAAKNDLSIDQEEVSRHHARIAYDGSHYRVSDLASTNGTFVNDRVVKDHILQDGDQVRIGRAIVKFMTGDNIEAHYHEEIYRLMTVDGLTQVWNKRYFEEALEREFNRARRYKRTLSLVLFDIDHFKKINDTYGHLAGDNILRELAGSVKPKLRREDLLARVGGEEFGVLLPEIPLEGARVTAQKVRRIVEETKFSFDSIHVPCTVSLGIAELAPDAKSGTSLFEDADKQLYAAKNAGRNRVEG